MATSASLNVCDIARDALSKSNQCVCDGSEASKTKAQCTVDGKLITEPPASCSVLTLASRRDLYFKTQYDPATALKGGSLRKKILANIGADIELEEKKVKQAYGDDAPVDDISYWRMQRCLVNKDGTRGTFNNRYVNRETLEEKSSYAPQPAIGASFLKGRIPAKLTNLLPVLTDRLMDPSLMVVVLLIIMLIILWVLITKAIAGKRAKYMSTVRSRVDKVKEENLDNPFAYLGDSYEESKSDDLRLKIPEYEARGYCMAAYRKKLGMPSGPNC